MKFTLLVTTGLLISMSTSYAAACANGVYRAGCAGPNGAAVVRKPYVPPPPHRATGCVNGVYRAGCAGPNGAAVVRKPYPGY
jgi:hypothetical protein